MNKSLLITNVKVITKIEKPIVVLETQGHEPIVRSLTQFLTDLQNSGRALNVRSVTEPAFIDACHAVVGATVTGDITPYKAGSKYKLDATHPDVVAGKANVGDEKAADKDGVRIEGFLSIPLTFMERQVKANADAYATFMGNMFGAMMNIAPAVSATPANSFTPEEDEDDVLNNAVSKRKAQAEKVN